MFNLLFTSEIKEMQVKISSLEERLESLSNIMEREFKHLRDFIQQKDDNKTSRTNEIATRVGHVEDAMLSKHRVQEEKLENMDRRLTKLEKIFERMAGGKAALFAVGAGMAGIGALVMRLIEGLK
jgi:cystathionine beta-lyase/cystathionine gamma-synthase